MIITAIICFSSVGLALGILLAIANRFLYVQVDPREDRIIHILPGINCGACSYPGCSAYAAAVAGSDEELNKCIPGGIDTAHRIGAIMGKSVKKMVKRTARVYCNGGRDKSPERFHYSGISSCVAVHIIQGGNKSCLYGCLGLGDCKRVCAFGAITIREDGISSIDENKCTTCGKCVAACPRSLIHIIPADKRVVVACSSKDPGPETRRNCTVGCIACRLCVKACPSKAITVENNLAYIHPEQCTLQKACIPVCPMHTIVEMTNPKH